MSSSQPTSSIKISVIIPCYNVEQYVEGSVRSILQQTLGDIQVICIDDGSTDDTLQRLTELAEQDNRIIVLSQENSGQGAARNRGVTHATGKYLYFMDSDDLLESDALEVLYRCAEDRELDVLCFDGVSFFESARLRQEQSMYVGFYIRKHDYSHIDNGPELLRAMTEHKEYRQSPCLQLIRRQFFLDNALWFLPGIIHEDNAFTFKTMLSAQKAAHLPRAFFRRRVRKNSVMTAQKTFDHCYGLFVCYYDMLRFVDGMELTEPQQKAVVQRLKTVVKDGKKAYQTLPAQELARIEQLSPMERYLFRCLMPPAKPAPDFDHTSYRVGRVVTFLPRSARAVFRSWKTNGFKVTVKKSFQKLKSLVSKFIK